MHGWATMFQTSVRSGTMDAGAAIANGVGNLDGPRTILQHNSCRFIMKNGKESEMPLMTETL